MKLKGYNVFGLKVNSCMKLEYPGLNKAYSKPDAVIKFGTIKKPSKKLSDTVYKPYTIYNKDFYFLDIPPFAKYQVNGSNEIVIDVYKENQMRDVSVFLHDTIISVLLLKNDIFSLNASAVKNKNGIYVFMGTRGLGKSALAALLCLNGDNKLISDEKFVPFWNEKKKIYESKCYSPYIRLWRDIVAIIKREHKRKKFNTQKIRASILKFKLDFSKYSYKKNAPIKAIFILNVENEKNPVVADDLKGMAKINALNNCINLSPSLKILNKDRQAFKYCAKVIKHIPIVHLKRNQLTKIRDFNKFVDNEIHQRTT